MSETKPLYVKCPYCDNLYVWGNDECSVCDNIGVIEAPYQDLKELGWIKADIKSVCRWFIESYPDDVFTGESKDIGACCVSTIVKECKKILGFGKIKEKEKL